MKKDDRTTIRSLKCAMAFVLAVGIVPVAPAAANESAKTASESDAATVSDVAAPGIKASNNETASAGSFSDVITKENTVETPAESEDTQDEVATGALVSTGHDVAGNDAAALSTAETDQTAENEASETAARNTQSNTWQT